MVEGPAADDGRCTRSWVRRFLDDLAVVRSAHTVRAYAADLERWLGYCDTLGVRPFNARPGTVIGFIRAERGRAYRPEKTVGARTIVRRLSAIRQWYAYLALEPERTGVHRNPIPAGTAIRAGAGVTAQQPALLRYDQPLPQVLSAEEIDGFLARLAATRYRDRAIVWLLKDGGLRIGEVLGLRLGDINWARGILTVRATKNKRERLVPVTQEAIAILSNYVRLERPTPLPHDVVFVNLGRRGYGRPFRYRSWVAICEQARRAAQVPRVHAHASRHTFATNMAEGGMPLDALQRVLGHRHLDTVMIYNQVRDGRVYREYQEAMAVQEAARRLRERRPEERS
jgi:site-specific recombinase XerD